MTLEHSNSKNSRTDSSVLDVLIIEEEVNSTPTTTVNGRSYINSMLVIEGWILRNGKITYDPDKR